MQERSDLPFFFTTTTMIIPMTTMIATPAQVHPTMRPTLDFVTTVKMRRNVGSDFHVLINTAVCSQTYLGCLILFSKDHVVNYTILLMHRRMFGNLYDLV